MTCIRIFIIDYVFRFLQIELKLIHRLSLSICTWTECLKGINSEGGVDTSMDTTPSSAPPVIQLGGTPLLEVCI